MKDSQHYTDTYSGTGRLVMVIGQSGSGHSTALDCLEDSGFSAIDNLPLALIDQLVALSVETEKKQLAVGLICEPPALMKKRLNGWLVICEIVCKTDFNRY